MTASVPARLSPGSARIGTARAPSLADWVWAGAAAAALLPLTVVEIAGAVRLPADGAWLAATLTLYAVLHVTVALRRRWLRAALVVASVCMLGLVLASLPAMPYIAVLLPSSLCFLIVVFTAAASDDRLADLGAVVVGLVGAAMITAVAVPWAPTAQPSALIALAGFLIASIGAAWALGRYRREARRKLVAQEVGRAQAAELRLQADRAAGAAERRRIGRELHDVISHSLAVMVAQAEAARVLQGRDDARSRVAIEQVVATGRTAMSDMRGLLGALAEQPPASADAASGAPSDALTDVPLDPPREPSPGLDDVRSLVESVAGPQRSAGYTVSGAQREVSPGVALAAYRVVQESLTNTLRHTSPPTRSDVQLTWGDELVVVVTDDGDPSGLASGSDAASCRRSTGRGIRGMRDRVEQVGGSFESGPSSGGGWRTRAALPLAAEASGD